MKVKISGTIQDIGKIIRACERIQSNGYCAYCVLGVDDCECVENTAEFELVAEDTCDG